jgi:hypothetical protein
MRSSPSNDRIEQAFTAALALAWEEGSPVAGSTPAARAAVAAVALRRIRSFDRRDVPPDRGRQVNDLAAGLVARLEPRPELVGPLLQDYRFIAAALLTALDEIAPTETGEPPDS